MKYTERALSNLIKQENEKAAAKREELTVTIKQQKQELETLKQQYFVAVSEGDTSAIDEFNEKVKALSESIRQNQIMLEVLTTKGNPIIQQHISNAMLQWDDELRQAEAEAKKLYESLLPHHQAVIKGLEQLQVLRDRCYGSRYNIDRYAEKLNDDSKQALQYPSAFVSVDIRKYMNPLLITQYVKR